jgi:hypothetical protein
VLALNKVSNLFFFTDQELYYSGSYPLLPSWYSEDAFKNDVLAMFLKKPKRLGRHNLQIIKTSEDFDSATFSMEEWARIQRFYIKFQKTRLFQEILEYFNTPYEAARWFLTLIAAKAENISKDRYNPAGLPDTLSLILSESNNGIDIPFLAGGQGAGKGHYSIKYLKKALKIQEILKKLMLKYKGASEVATNKIETIEPSSDLEPVYISSLSEIPSIFVSQYALPDDLFYYKAATKQLQKPQWYEYQKQPKKYVMLLDISGSMDECEKYIYATASAIALIKNAQRSGVNKAIIVPFDSDVHEPIEGDAEQCIQQLMNLPFSGGGTNIDRALEYADSLNADEIILITDGEDSVYYKPNTKLYTVFCLPGGNYKLEEISYDYEEVDACEM